MSEGTVFIGSRDNFIYAIDSASGDEVLSFETGDSVVRTPAVVDSTVYVGSWDGNLYALDATSGDEQWTNPNGGGTFTPAIADGTINSGSVAIDIESGETLWQYDVENSTAFSGTTVAGNTVFFGELGPTLYALTDA